jgi:hypothetical protein
VVLGDGGAARGGAGVGGGEHVHDDERIDDGTRGDLEPWARGHRSRIRLGFAEVLSQWRRICY